MVVSADFEQGTPVARPVRKATGLQGDSRVAEGRMSASLFPSGIQYPRRDSL